jgi:hypothetical protein
MHRSTRLFLAPFVALLGLCVLPSPGMAIVIDSFTDALPPNPLLTASGRPILYLGSACDGASCPPAESVRRLPGYDAAEQVGLPGVYASWRRTHLGSWLEENRKSYEGEGATLRIDPALGGSLILACEDKRIYVFLEWGDPGYPLDVNCVAEGIDRVEIEILSAPAATITGTLRALSYDANHDVDASREWIFTMNGPGIVTVPLALDDDVDNVSIFFNPQEGGATDVVIGEVRLGSTTVPAETSSWGRLKAAYRH